MQQLAQLRALADPIAFSEACHVFPKTLLWSYGILIAWRHSWAPPLA